MGFGGCASISLINKTCDLIRLTLNYDYILLVDFIGKFQFCFY